jgi:RHS repeat-associated protein
VNTWNGNLFYPISILNILGRGVPIGVSMSYNSGWHNFMDHYGYGWQLSYNVFYTRDENGDITIARGDGGTDRFTNDNGIYLAPADVYDTLHEYEPGKYLLRNKYGLEYYFDDPIHKGLTKLEEPNGNALTFSYDSNMLLTSITDATGRRVDFAYADDRVASITGPENRSVTFQYDVDDNLVGMTDALGYRTTYSYDVEHHLSGIVDARGNATAVNYANGAVSSVIGAFAVRSFSYDAELGVTTLTDVLDGHSQVSRFYYDTGGRIISIEDPLGNSISMIWDGHNNLTSLTDGNDNTTNYTYDSMGNVLTVTDADSHVTTYTYDSASNKVASIADAGWHVTAYDYDSKGNLIGVTEPLGHTIDYSYDDVGNLVSKTDANGFTTTYEYDEYGNVTSYLDNTFTYDDVGNMLSMSNSNASVTYDYDDLNRVTDVDYSSGKSVHYTYDEVGNRSSMTDPEGGITTYDYDDANRLLGLTNPLGQTTTYTYDSIGRVTRRDYSNGTYTTYIYDDSSRLRSLTNKNSSGDVLSSYTYEYDAAGNRTSMTEANGDRTTYAYDDLYQLTSVIYPDSSTATYGYDPVGNRQVLTSPGGDTGYTYDDEDRLQTAGPATYGWDNNGNLVSKTDAAGTTTYAYDNEGRLTSITFPDASTNSFTYYPDSRRLSKTNSSGETTYYFYDGPNAVVETDSGGGTIARYTSGLGIDDWVSMDRGGSSYYYLYDGLGSVTGLADPGQSLAATYNYDVFGTVKSQTGNVINPYTYTGREYDNESDLYYYRARYYDAAVGRFVTADPFTWGPDDSRILHPSLAQDMYPPGLITSIGQRCPQLLHSYLYVVNNPSNYVDPYGYGKFSWGEFIKWVWNLAPVKPLLGVVGSFLLDLLFPQPLGDGDEVPRGGSGSGGGGGSGVESQPLDLSSGAPLLQLSNPLVTLEDIVPTDGPDGTTAVPSTPGLTELTNAVDALVMDFVDSTSQVKASVVGIETVGQTYEHDYSVCNKFHGYTLESAAPLALPGVFPGTTDVPWFWYLSSTKGELVEEGFIFTVFVDEDQSEFTVDSRWLTDYYPSSIDPKYEYVFNFRTYASSSEEAYKLVQGTLERLSSYGTVSFANTAEPVPPTVTIKSAEYADDNIDMIVQSWLPETRTARFFGSMRYTNGIADRIPFEYNRTVEPGINVVQLPATNLRDALVFTETDGFLDKVFVAQGDYLLVDDFPDSDPKNRLGGDSFLFWNSGYAELAYPEESLQLYYNVSAIGGYAGYVTLLNEFDLRPYNSVTFLIKGASGGEKAKIGLVDSSNNEHKILVSEYLPEGITTQWQEVRVPFAVFTRVVDWSSMSKLVISFENVLGDDEGTVYIDDIRFEQSPDTPIVVDNFNDMTGENGLAGLYWAYAEGSAVIDAGYDTENRYGPTGAGYRISYNVSEDNYAFLSSDLMVLNAAGYNTLSLYIKGANGGERPNIYLGDGTARQYVDLENYASVTTSWQRIDIPLEDFVKQGIDVSDLRYTQVVFERETMAGTVYLDDIQIANVSRTYLLVDDFSDLDTRNSLGGESFPFWDNAAIGMDYSQQSLELSYDVSIDHSYAGYITLLNQFDLRPYNAVTFLVKGAEGGEKAKVGLVNSSDNEHKILVSEYLPGGITTQWQQVRIPLAAFTRVADWSSMSKLAISFENVLGDNDGTIYVDDIRFEQLADVPIVLDNFNDMTGENGLAGLYWAYAEGSAVIDAGYDTENRYGPTGAGYRISYNVSEGNYAFLSSDLMVLNAAGYNTLSLYIKGANGGERPSIYLGDGTTREYVDIENYAPVTTSWQKIDIPLEDFVKQGIDISDLRYVQVVFERETVAGTVYLDDIQIANVTRTYLAVDDFSDLDTRNSLGGESFPFWDNAAIGMDYSQQFLELDYYVSIDHSHAGYITLLYQFDLRPYNALTFLIKGAGGGEKAKVGLVDSSDNEHKILVSEYLPGGITTQWQQVRIPFAAFTHVADWSSMSKLVISLENGLGTSEGIIDIDDIEFERSGSVPIVVDNFNDMTDENGLAGLYSTYANGAATIEAGYDTALKHGGAGASYRIAYDVTETDDAFLSSDLMVLNASGYDTLSFYIKGAAGGEKPNVYLSDGIVRRYVDVEEYAPITVSWQKIDVPLEDFIKQGIDATDLRYVQLAFEWEQLQGTVYLDDVQLELGSDLDGDGVSNAADNCPTTHNTNQMDTDRDALGDACDADDDGDGFPDAKEIYHGSDPLDPYCANTIDDDAEDDNTVNDGCAKKAGAPESGAACGNALDDDADTWVNDGCPLVGERGEGSLVEVCDGLDNDGDTQVDEGYPDTNPGGPKDCMDSAVDTDGDTVMNTSDTDDDGGNPGAAFDDGVIDGRETWMGTDTLDACADDANDDAWPPDIDNNRTVNINDVLMYRPVVGSIYGGTQPRDRPYDRRFDLNADKSLNINDVLSFIPHVGKTCTN